MRAGVRHGRGLLRWSDGSLYIGQFDGDHPHGAGVEQYADGSVYVGEFRRDERSAPPTLPSDQTLCEDEGSHGGALRTKSRLCARDLPP